MTKRNFISLIGLFLLVAALGFIPQPGMTQDTDVSCPELVKQALVELGDNCGGLERNAACYGYNRVGATFVQAVTDDFFTKPSDLAGLDALASIQTAPLDETLQEWGVAVLSVQANIPDTLPGQAVRFILLGDSQITNDVPADVGSAPVEAIEVRVVTAANIRSGPTRNANVLTSEPSGTILLADGLSEDGEWLRVAYKDTATGWINRQLVTSDADIDSLPVAGALPLTSMQAFHLRTNLGEVTCDEAPSALVVQGPKQTKIQITANGVDIQLGSTVILQTLNEETFKLTTIDGLAVVEGLNVPAGYTTEADLDENGDVDGNFGRVLPLTRDELEKLQVLENISPDVLNYLINVPSQVATPAPRPTAAPGAPTTAAPSGDASCAGFKATSPLDGLNYGLNTFFWDAAPGATSYRLTVIGAGSTEVGAPTTTTTFDLYNAGQQFQMSWYVEALVNGQVACTSQTVTIPREANPPPFTASWQCGPGDGQVTVSYQYAPPGSNSVTIQIYSLEISDTRPFPPYSASVTYDNFYGGGGVVIANPSGAQAGLPDLFCRTS